MATTERILELLGLFQSRPVWTAPELAAQLGVTERTVRRDVDRLRDLGYAIGAARGAMGGYRLRRGQVVPPLLLTDDEAVAVALALRLVGENALLGDPEPALRALLKLDAGLPARTRARLTGLAEAIRTAPADSVPVDVDLLTTLADAVTSRVQVRLDYTDRSSRTSHRRVEPHRLVAWHRRWYLAAFDLDRADWRTFRLDRLSGARATTFRFTRRPDEPDLTQTLEQHHATDAYRHRVELLVHAPVAELADYERYATLEPVDASTTRLVGGADDPDAAARWLVQVPQRVSVLGDEAVREAAARLAGRLGEMLAPPGEAPGGS